MAMWSSGSTSAPTARASSPMAFLDRTSTASSARCTPKVGYYTLTEYDETYYDMGCRVDLRAADA